MNETLVKNTENQETFKEEYWNVVQADLYLADTQNVIIEGARGIGKTSKMFTERLVRVSYDLRGSIVLLLAPTYKFVLETLMPAVIASLKEAGYVRGIDFEFGKRPPANFALPYSEPESWNHTLIFAWGTAVKAASQDRVESVLGQNASHGVADESLKIKEEFFRERFIPALRGNREIFGESPYFAGFSLFSSTPNMENDHDWWLEYEKQMNRQRIEEIKAVALRIDQAEYKLELLTESYENGDITTEDYLQKKEKLDYFLAKWGKRLREKRKGQYFYLRASSFSNYYVLGIDYFKQQLTGTGSNFNKFKLSTLTIRPSRVGEMFCARFNDDQHVFTDSYDYRRNADKKSISDGIIFTAADLKYYNRKQPLYIGYDPGGFSSVVAGQLNNNLLRILKDFYVYSPEGHKELAEKINAFFACRENKKIYLHYDRAGNKRLSQYKDNPKGKTDAYILKKELEDMGWNVELMSLSQRTIYHWEHYILQIEIFNNTNPRKPWILIDGNECECLVSSIKWTAIKRKTDSMVEMDKSAEYKLPFNEQAMYSPQIYTALCYLLWGLFSDHMPETNGINFIPEGL